MGRVHDNQLLFDETWSERWKRRLVTGPALLALTPAYLSALPATLSAAAAVDLARRQPWTASRFAAAVAVNLSMHSAAFAGVFLAWLAGGRWAGADPEFEWRFEQALQVAWARATWDASARLYGMKLSIEGADCAAPGPILLLPRHSSLLDTLLPLLEISGPLNLRLRYVAKRELLWDPMLDAVGHRWPTAFVRRGTRDPRELEHIGYLASDLGERDAVVLFPEGTRFSPAKRERILEKLGDEPERLERARRLRSVLPPHLGGVRSVLQHNRALDVVFFAHSGLEGANHFQDLMAGALIGTTVRGKLWRVRRADIPDESNDPGEFAAWLHEHWESVDRWVCEQSSSSSAAAPSRG